MRVHTLENDMVGERFTDGAIDIDRVIDQFVGKSEGDDMSMLSRLPDCLDKDALSNEP